MIAVDPRKHAARYKGTSVARQDDNKTEHVRGEMERFANPNAEHAAAIGGRKEANAVMMSHTLPSLDRSAPRRGAKEKAIGAAKADAPIQHNTAHTNLIYLLLHTQETAHDREHDGYYTTTASASASAAAAAAAAAVAVAAVAAAAQQSNGNVARVGKHKKLSNKGSAVVIVAKLSWRTTR